MRLELMIEDSAVLKTGNGRVLSTDRTVMGETILRVKPSQKTVSELSIDARSLTGKERKIKKDR